MQKFTSLTIFSDHKTSQCGIFIEILRRRELFLSQNRDAFGLYHIKLDLTPVKQIPGDAACASHIRTGFKEIIGNKSLSLMVAHVVDWGKVRGVK